MSKDDARNGISQLSQYRQLVAWLLLVLALTAAVRLMGITRPLLGNFSTKNVVYAMIARNWAEGRASLWYPTVDVLCGGRRGWHMLEFPVSAYLTATLWRTFGGSLDVWGRLTAVTFSVASVAVMYAFVRRRHGPSAAIAAAIALGFSPISIIYGQSFMLEASLVFFTLATFYSLDRWLDRGRVAWLLAAAIFLALLLLTKLYMVVVLLPLGMAVFRRPVRGVSGGEGPENALLSPTESPPTAAWPAWLPAKGLAVSAATLAMIPAAIWYVHAYCAALPEAPAGDRVYYSVLDSAAEHAPPHPLLCSADFYRQILDDLTGVVLTPIGFMLVLAGMLHRRRRAYVAWLVAMVALLVLLPRKFHQMNYYWMAVLPPLCVMIGLGWQVVASRMRPGRPATTVLLLSSVVLSLRYAAGPAFITPQADRGVPDAAEAVQQFVDHTEPVVTMHGTAIDLLYYCRHPGWALGPDQPDLNSALDECVHQGARYLVVVGRGPDLPVPDEQGDGYTIYFLGHREGEVGRNPAIPP